MVKQMWEKLIKFLQYNENSLQREATCGKVPVGGGGNTGVGNYTGVGNNHPPDIAPPRPKPSEATFSRGALGPQYPQRVCGWNYDRYKRDMAIQELKNKASGIATTYSHSLIVFPKHCNHHYPLIFGGELMAEIDLSAAHCVRKLLHSVNPLREIPMTIEAVTHKSEIEFKRPSYCGDTLDFEANVVSFGKKSIRVLVTVKRGDVLIATGRLVFITIFGDQASMAVKSEFLHYVEHRLGDYLVAPTIFQSKSGLQYNQDFEANATKEQKDARDRMCYTSDNSEGMIIPAERDTYGR